MDNYYGTTLAGHGEPRVRSIGLSKTNSRIKFTIHNIWLDGSIDIEQDFSATKKKQINRELLKMTENLANTNKQLHQIAYTFIWRVDKSEVQIMSIVGYDRDGNASLLSNDAAQHIIKL